MEIDTRSKAQKRADRWAERFREIAAEHPEASPTKICEIIAGKEFTRQAVYGRLRAMGVITAKQETDGYER
ncbi:MAG: hypothetical protein NC344_09775 [Bacteroidales bacterium]|nr:hypothetical protein [Bacteroidales bacterium]MCM1148092.1 hypothetical protein [Bacteroidales bacterium]MCM1509452.1 hypothetical protein [Clostridium sp.]